MRRNEFGQPIGDPVTWVPRPFPEPDELVGDHCRLVPWSRNHLESLYDAVVRDSPPSTWTYLRPPDQSGPEGLADLLDSLSADSGAVPLVVCALDGAALGTASYLRIDAANGSVEVGWIVYSAALQRTTAATEAMYLMMQHAFDDLGYRRYEWKCDSLNEPSRRAAERLGFTYEGTFRQAMVYQGRNRDTAWFSITSEEWPRVRAGFQAWLDPRNFGPDGVQRRPLSTQA